MANQSYVRPYLREAVEKERTYDPRQAVQESTSASWAAISRDVKEELERLRGNQVGRGRLNTGFGYEDEDRLYRDALERQANITSQRALEGEGLYADSRNRYLELLSGEDDRYVRDENRKQRKRGGLGGLIGGVLGAGAGFLFGGGFPGAAAGWKAGSGIGSYVGSYA